MCVSNRIKEKAKELTFIKNGWVCPSPLIITGWMKKKNSRPRQGYSLFNGGLLPSLSIAGKSTGPEAEDLDSIPAMLLLAK